MKKGTKKESAKGTLHYRDYSNNERKMMQKYVRQIELNAYPFPISIRTLEKIKEQDPSSLEKW